MKPRLIFHVDMDAFFASIEIIKNPSLRGLPVVVGGNPDHRGVVSTCSYEARVFGVRSAMPLSEAKRRCPQAIFLEGNYRTYKAYSAKIMALFSHYVPCLEIVSIDEAYMDATEIADQFGGALALGELIRTAVYTTTGLTCTIGIATNKLVAKIAASYAKPNRVYEIPQGKEKEFLAPLKIQSLPGIGAKTQLTLNHDGYQYITDLQTVPMEDLIHQYGTRGYYYHLAAHGIDTSPVTPEHGPPKSIGAETTFDSDQTDLTILLETLQALAEKIHRRLLINKMRTKGISVKIRHGDFKTMTRHHSFSTHINDLNLIWEEAKKLFLLHYEEETPLRLLGISLEKLNEGYWQPTLWDPM